ncbi:hypothetical protein PFISCL1PPCAC_25614 [Pristionchus fissidentatus]|uniref:Uncharacterized protein n=1 Tax=Pristionchus fissidentatus TaxID=1538716 RepID=A0AAV5WX13_9BILA|nr:hypothetical protein PFISCL1PPCAC_25614 [Pristionchus fissidentatus]
MNLPPYQSHLVCQVCPYLNGLQPECELFTLKINLSYGTLTSTAPVIFPIEQVSTEEKDESTVESQCSSDDSSRQSTPDALSYLLEDPPSYISVVLSDNLDQIFDSLDAISAEVTELAIKSKSRFNEHSNGEISTAECKSIFISTSDKLGSNAVELLRLADVVRHASYSL